MALLAIAAVAMYGWIVSPHVSYLHAVQRYEPVLAEATKEKKLLSAGLAAKRRRLEQVQTQLTAARAGLFTPEQAQDFFGGIDDLCRKSGCTVTAIHFDSDRDPRTAGAPKPAMVQTRRAGLTASGGYPQIVALLHDLQARPQRVVIDSCRIELSDARSGRVKCDVTMIIWVISTEEDSDDA